MKELASPYDFIPPQAIIKIQSFFRQYQARKSFHISNLSSAERTKDLVFQVGNDPIFTDLKGLQQPGKKALVGLSGLRSLSLAAELSADKPCKLFIVDTSAKVIEFWQHFQDYVAKQASLDAFYIDLHSFIEQVRPLCRDGSLPAFADKSKYYSLKLDDLPLFFDDLFHLTDYSMVRSIVLNASIIAQSWTNIDTFEKIKNICDYQGRQIYTYSSSLKNCLQWSFAEDGNPEPLDNFLYNLHVLNPVISIHTFDHREIKTGGLFPNCTAVLQNHNLAFLKEHFHPEGNLDNFSKLSRRLKT